MAMPPLLATVAWPCQLAWVGRARWRCWPTLPSCCCFSFGHPFFDPFLLPFAALAQLDLLPTKVNKTSKNSKQNM